MIWNYADMLDAVATAVPADRPALIWRDVIVPWGEFDRRTNCLGRNLIEHGLRPDDRMAILCRNHPSYIEGLAAALKARVLSVNLNYRYTAGEISYIMEDCGASALIYQDVFEDVVSELKERLGSSVKIWIRIESDRCIGQSQSALSFEELSTVGDNSPIDIQRAASDGYLLYTGGTTGRPKGVHWPTDQARRVAYESPLVSNPPQSMDEHLALVRANKSPTRVLPACPLMHGTGANAALSDLLSGGSAVILPSERFSADEFWREVERHSVTRAAIVGDTFAKPLLGALDDAPGKYDLSSLAVITSSGLTWTKEVKEGLLRHLPWLLTVDILGASEAAGFGFSIARKGEVLPTGVFDAGLFTVLLDPDTGEVLPKDREVEGFLARTGTMPIGYYGDDVKTAATYKVIDGERYAVPGDFARWLPPNQFIMIGRGNLSINTGGEKVFPEEVEEELKRLPGIQDALVVGQPDEKWGKIVVAVVRPAENFDESAVRLALSKKLSTYKHPKRFVLVAEVPRHESGKPDYRRALDLINA